MEVLTEIKIAYALYPSLLDAYLRYKRHDDEETFTSLFNKINNVKTDQTEQQIKGVDFEDCVSLVIDSIKTGSVCSPVADNGEYIMRGNRFECSLIDEIAGKLSAATKTQEYMEAIIPTHIGNIKLYGITDFSFPEMISDLKGTGNYSYGKYKDNTQHPVYSLIRKLNGNPIKAFKYVVSDFNNMFIETYIPTENMHDKLMVTVFEFIRFLEHFKKYITNPKIFGGNI